MKIYLIFAFFLNDYHDELTYYVENTKLKYKSKLPLLLLLLQSTFLWGYIWFRSNSKSKTRKWHKKRPGIPVGSTMLNFLLSVCPGVAVIEFLETGLLKNNGYWYYSSEKERLVIFTLPWPSPKCWSFQLRMNNTAWPRQP